MEADRPFLAWRQGLNVAMKAWQDSKGHSDLLLRGRPLDEALDWLRKKSEELSPRERAYLAASKNRRIRGRVAAAIVASLIVALVGWPIAWLWKEGVTVPYAGSIVLARLHLVQMSEPDMVEIPEGTYQQGDQDYNEKREVTVKRFKIGKYEVTFQEYDQYVELAGGRSPKDYTWGRARQPVIDVSWEDAKAYAKWLSSATGKAYRLPTESEWEYAARSRGKNDVWAGTSDESQLKDYAVYNAARTELVGSKQPNHLGLHDMSGNVWEWVEDCYHGDYNGAPKDGSAWLETDGHDCDHRVVRGGSYDSRSVDLRVASRVGDRADFRSSFIGFRLAQDID